MEHLQPIRRHHQFSLYRIQNSGQETITRYLVSTPMTRQICNNPKIFGCLYSSLLKEAVKLTLNHLPEKKSLLKIPEDQFCVFHFLLGGLNFGIRHALHEAYGFNRHVSSFMTSQRIRIKKKWRIRNHQYRKLNVPSNAVLLIGDVVATGATIKNGLATLLKHFESMKIHIQRIIFFTIGCHNAEQILNHYDKAFKNRHPGYRGTTLIYFEAKFGLASETIPLRIQIPGTDLIRTHALVAPEFALSQYEDLLHPLERCAIYDAGSRAFNPSEYLDDVEGYWQEVARLAQRGYSYYNACKERWPEQDWENINHLKSKTWPTMDISVLRTLHRAHQKRWTKAFIIKAQQNSFLLKLCQKRLKDLFDWRNKS